MKWKNSWEVQIIKIYTRKIVNFHGPEYMYFKINFVIKNFSQRKVPDRFAGKYYQMLVKYLRQK
jgi:hypothetical protein